MFRMFVAFVTIRGCDFKNHGIKVSVRLNQVVASEYFARKV